MEVDKNYKSFNSSKSIEELQYNISNDIIRLENLKLELAFYLDLIDKPIFKNHIINLYEILAGFKSEIKDLEKNRVNLLNDTLSHANHIRNKIECDEVACDNFFVKQHDTLELRIFNFYAAITELKFSFFQYLESVFIN